MKIFVTGSTGFIGQHFIERLLTRITNQNVVYVLTRKKTAFDHLKLKELRGSLEEIEKFSPQLMEADYVFHLAANPVFGSGIDYDKTNFLPVCRMVDILKQSQSLRNFIFTSTVGAFDRHPKDRCDTPLDSKSQACPTSLYGKSKLKSEAYIKSSGIPYTIIRPTWVYGRNMRTNSHINVFVSMVLNKSLATHLAFPGKVSLIHVDDLSMALVNCIDNDKVIGKSYFAETQALSVGDIFKVIHKNINGKAPKQVTFGMSLLRCLLARVHSHVPLTVANLFIDYLYASEKMFIKDFFITQEKSIHDHIRDVIETNINLTGKWVITGSGNGIGLSLARELKKRSVPMILVDKNTMQLIKEFEEEIIFEYDLSDEEQVRQLAEQLNGYKIKTLVNNAGVGFAGNFDSLSVKQILTTIDVNIRAPLLLTRLLMDNLRANNASIVIIASSTAYNPLPHMSVYAASKAFLTNWSEAMAYELSKTNVVTTVSPSGTNTEFQKAAGVKNGGKGLLSPDYVAKMILRSIEKKRGVVVLGVSTKIMLLACRLMPRSIAVKLWGRLFERLK